MSAVVIKLSSLNSHTLRNTVTAWYTRAGVSRERAEGQRAERRGEEGSEKGRPKKKLWVQGLMMGPEAMADSVATPAKTTLKRRLQFNPGQVQEMVYTVHRQLLFLHEAQGLGMKLPVVLLCSINMPIRRRTASCGSVLFPRARGILNFVPPPFVFVCDLYS